MLFLLFYTACRYRNSEFSYDIILYVCMYVCLSVRPSVWHSHVFRNSSGYHQIIISFSNNPLVNTRYRAKKLSYVKHRHPGHRIRDFYEYIATSRKQQTVKNTNRKSVMITDVKF